MKTFRSAYSQKERIYAPLHGPSMTKQSFRDECDINTIMARYMKTGVLDFANKHAPQYADVSNIDFAQAMADVLMAKSMFDDLPAKIRARFSNDPGQFLAFIDNPDNASEMLAMGLIVPRATTPPAAPENGATGSLGASAGPSSS